MKNLEKIIAIIGPTASGKTDKAIKLAQFLDGEIISADSRLVYKDFNIGTAKPTTQELAIIPHYMIDLVTPEEEFTVNLFRNQADNLIQDILSRGKVPIIAGGTGFYIKALLEGFDIPEVKPNNEFREEMRKLVEENGREYLHKLLMEKDPKTASKLYINDSFRVIRALEVIQALGKPMSEVQTKTGAKYNIIYAGLCTENRDYLYERINRRVDIMISQGLVKEVKSLIEKYGKTISLLKTLGYKEICEYLDGLYSEEEAIEQIKKNTRNYAKRQLTWFRANKEAKWYFIDNLTSEEICSNIIETYQNSW